jgi:hypothetical protein
MLRTLITTFLTCMFIQCRNPSVNQTKSISSDSTTNDTTSSALLATKEKTSSQKEPVSLGTIISKIEFKIKTNSLTDYPDGYIPWIAIEFPEKEIINLCDRDKTEIEDSVVTLIIDYPLDNPYKGQLKSKNGFTKKQQVRLISTTWRSLKYSQKMFFAKVANELGSHPAILYGVVKFLNKVGSEFIPDGIEWISDMISANNNLQWEQLETPTVWYLEKICRKFVYLNRTKLKQNQSLKDRVLVILNFIIVKGSVNGYLLREEIL